MKNYFARPAEAARFNQPTFIGGARGNFDAIVFFGRPARFSTRAGDGCGVFVSEVGCLTVIIASREGLGVKARLRAV